MKKQIKVLASALTALLVSAALSGCGSKPTSSGSSGQASGGKTITVWSHLTDQEVAAIKPIAEQWAKQTGNTVKVLADKGDFQGFLQAANSSKGPDIMYGIAHDNLGTYHQANIIAQVPDGLIDKTKYYDEAINAVSYDGKMFAVPIAEESIGLIYNTDKVQTPPATWDEFTTSAKQLGFKFEAKNLYYNYPFLSANGGYIFKSSNGTLDPKDLGVANDGAKKGYAMLQSFKNDFKIDSSVTNDIASGEFKAGKIAYFLSGSWEIQGIKDKGIKFKVALLPTINGQHPRTFLGVQAAFVNAKSKNQKEAWDLMKYLLENTEKPLFEVGNRLPVLKDSPLNAEVSSSDFEGFAEQAKYADPMPNIPEMTPVWKMNDSLPLLMDGKMTPDAYANKALKDTQAAIAQQK